MLRSLRIIVVNSLAGILLFSYLYYSETSKSFNYIENGWLIAAILSGSNLLGYSILFSNRLIERFYSWKRGVFNRFIIGVILNYFILTGIVSFFAFIYGNYILNTGFGDLIARYPETAFRFLIISFILIFFFTIIDFAFYSYNYYSVIQIESVRLEREQLELQMDALKSQLTPHYLFNNLNTIYALIHQDALRAENYIRMLAQTYRYILDRHNERTTSVKDEQIFIEAYKYLLEIRFGRTVEVDIKLSDDVLEYFIPPLSLQILVENAVKHNTFDNESPLKIEILNDKGKIVVRNNISLSIPKTDSLKIGLNNLRKRYSYLTENSIQIISNKYFIVKIPVLKNNKPPYDKRVIYQ